MDTFASAQFWLRGPEGSSHTDKLPGASVREFGEIQFVSYGPLSWHFVSGNLLLRATDLTEPLIIYLKHVRLT